MRILIVGNPNSVWIHNYIRYVLNQDYYIVDVLYIEPIKEEFLHFYKERNVKIIGAPISKKPNIVSKKFCAVKRRLYLILSRLFHSYNVIHLHFASVNSLKIACLAKHKNARLIVTPWGSDVLRASKKEMVSRIKYLDMADCITIQSEKLTQRMREVYGERYDSKYIFGLKMGIDIFDSLDSVIKQYTVADCKDHFGFSKNKILVGIGYNASSGQQHIPVLQAIESLSASIKEKMEIVMHISYSLESEEYIIKLGQAAFSTGCKIFMIDKFLYGEEMAQLRYATDIFVHAQTTDEYSASIQEYIYSGSILLNPEWIDYKEFSDNHINFVSYKDFQSLPSVFEKEINKFIINSPRLFCYNTQLKSLSAWGSYVALWRAIYKG